MDGLTDGRLGAQHANRGARKALLLHHGDEGLKLSDFHGAAPISISYDIRKIINLTQPSDRSDNHCDSARGRPQVVGDSLVNLGHSWFVHNGLAITPCLQEVKCRKKFS